MNLSAAYLWLASVTTIGFGVAYLVRSRAMARMVGIEIKSARARADYRSIYGGAQITIGVFFCLAALKPEWEAPGLAAVALFAAGFGVARLLSLAYERVESDFQWIVGALEVTAGMIGGLLLARLG
jgi:hypothetical protein